MRTNRDDIILTNLTDLVQSSFCTTDYAEKKLRNVIQATCIYVKCSHSSLLDCLLVIGGARATWRTFDT